MEVSDLPPLPPLARADRKNILSICGGGFAGLFAAEFLVQLEAHTRRPLYKVFDLVAGTSVGGLIALGVASGVPASIIYSLIRDAGPLIFGKPRIPFFRAKHDRQPLVERLESLFGKKAMSCLYISALIPAVDLTADSTVVFDRDYPYTICDVALATSAAPVYLQPHPVNNKIYADGGLVANSAEAISAIKATHDYCWDPSNTTMLVVGSTMKCGRVPNHLAFAGWGLRRWLSGNRLLTNMMNAQMSLARQQAETILGSENVLVADISLSQEEEKVVSLDNASMASIATLKGLAASQYEEFKLKNSYWMQSVLP